MLVVLENHRERTLTNYRLEQGSASGLRAVDVATGKTVVVAGRLLDNMSTAAAHEVLASLQHIEAVREENDASTNERGDLVAIFERRFASDGTANSSPADQVAPEG